MKTLMAYLVIAGAMLPVVSRLDAQEDLAKAFAQPPAAARPSGYWWWFNSLMNKEGITRDLEEFKAKGMGGVMIVWTGHEGFLAGVMPHGPVFRSPEWRELYKFALQEANRLGLEMGVNLCGGWCMGGPWITPENAGRWFLQSELKLTGPQQFSGTLPLPGPKNGYDSQPELMVGTYINLPLDKVDYRDTAVVAFREPANGSGLGAARKGALPAKSNRLDANYALPARQAMDQTLTPWTALPEDKPIAPADVIDLTSKMGPEGKLDWDVPEGSWTIVRTGHRMTGARVSLPMPENAGFEVDWLSTAAVDQHWENLATMLLADAGPLTGKTLKYFMTESFEDGYPNWTSRMLEQFQRYRGYDAKPYLPVFSGHLVGSAEVSERFLYDYRKTVADCMADNNYGHFAELSRAQGLEIACEAGGPSWSGTMCMDALKNLGRCDRPMGEFWQAKDFVADDQNQVCKQTASAAHIYGRKMALAESFTSFLPHWGDSPASLKPTADRAFCEGINRTVFHTTTGSRPQDGKPGYEYGAGTHFNPNVTWWNQGAGPWIAYITRCSTLLQSGRFAADVLFYNGDWAPNLVERKHVDPALGPGYDYDVCNAEVLLTRLAVKDGRIVLPDGMSYRLLALPDRKQMPVEVVQKIKELVAAGATVIGPKPESDPGLKDYPKCDEVVRRTAGEVWGEVDGKQVKERKMGQGRIIWGRSLREVLLADGVPPDFENSGDAPTDVRLDGASWIWHAADGLAAPECDRIFRMNWELPAAARAASVSITCDDAFKLKVNGQPVASGDLWSKPVTANLGAALRPGRNRIEVGAHNGAGGVAAGLIARFTATLADGQTLTLMTGAGWQSSADEQTWVPVQVLGPFGMQPWGKPDSRPAAGPNLDFIHRSSLDGEVYFVANRASRPRMLACTFRVSARQPELWDAVTGEMRPAEAFHQESGRTVVPLEFAPYGSCFVVFRKPIAADVAGQKARNYPEWSSPSAIEGGWEVAFDPKWGGPESVSFNRLESWHQRAEPGIKYYSGKATYRKTFDLPADLQKGGRLKLNLGVVKNLAEVRLNDRNLGVVWTEPYSVDITSAVKPAGNTLEIDVINLWPNRLIGDAALPVEKRLTRSNVSMDPGSPLLESGLLGPVTLQRGGDSKL